MTCRQIADQQLLEKYVAGKLPPAERDALEFHARACPDCGRRLRDLRGAAKSAPAPAAPAPSPKPSRRRPVSRRTRIGLALAVLLAAVAVAVWRTGGRVSLRRTEPQGRPLELRLPDGELQPIREKHLQELASFFPLPYQPPARLPIAAAGQQLQTAMQLYMSGQFAQAAPALEEVVRLQPDYHYARLYLGICSMLLGNNAKAERSFKEILDGKDDAYREEARFFRAKALFAQRDLEEGEKELRLLASGQSLWAQHARQMLALVEKVK
jgi:tetratricopeptide (TPR) repeat protein